MALNCSKSLWLFYLFCQSFSKCDKCLFKEMFLMTIEHLYNVIIIGHGEGLSIHNNIINWTVIIIMLVGTLCISSFVGRLTIFIYLEWESQVYWQMNGYSENVSNLIHFYLSFRVDLDLIFPVKFRSIWQRFVPITLVQ